MGYCGRKGHTMSGTAPPELRTIHAALDAAVRAPSVHNTQPWRWSIADRSLHLFADATRQLSVLDPGGRDMTISCGAALDHARLALAALGWHATVHRLPDPARRDHLATLELAPLHVADEHAAILAEAATHRYTDRRPFLNASVPTEVLDRVASSVGNDRVRVTMVTDPTRRRELVLALAHADLVQRADPRYRAELHEWAHQRSSSREGVLTGSVPAASPLLSGIPGRDFGAGDLESPPAVADGATLYVLSTATDEPLDWLLTGEALSAVLLTATVHNLASCTLSQVAESTVGRDLARLVALDGVGEPQVAVRLGRPITEVFRGPATPRRTLAEVVVRQHPLRHPADTGKASGTSPSNDCAHGAR